MKELDVSVILLTYNQERFIGKAIKSIIDQKFFGSWEVIVSNDSSTDDTGNIIEKYKIQFPDLIISKSNLINLGLAKNWSETVKCARGKYISYLEGDDYWTDEYKLQKQFDFLELNPKCILAFHNFVLIDEAENLISDSNLRNVSLQKNRSKKEMIFGCLIHQNTIMFRNILNSIPEAFFKARNHDTFFIAYLSNWGNAGYVNCSPLHYRILNNSLWSSLSQKQKHWNGILTLFWISTVVPIKYYPIIGKKVLAKIKYLTYSLFA